MVLSVWREKTDNVGSIGNIAWRSIDARVVGVETVMRVSVRLTLADRTNVRRILKEIKRMVRGSLGEGELRNERSPGQAAQATTDVRAVSIGLLAISKVSIESSDYY